MTAAILAILISAGVDLVTGFITRYQDLPETPDDMRIKLETLKLKLNQTKFDVEQVVIKDV